MQIKNTNAHIYDRRYDIMTPTKNQRQNKLSDFFKEAAHDKK